MYGLDIVTDSLFAIDKTTGAAALIGSIGFNANYAQDMTFDLETGVLYLGGLRRRRVHRLDLHRRFAIRRRESRGTLGASVQEVDAISTQTAGGPCAQPQDLPWLTLGPVAGTTLPGGASPVTATIDGTGTVDGDIRAGHDLRAQQ